MIVSHIVDAGSTTEETKDDLYNDTLMYIHIISLSSQMWQELGESVTGESQVSELNSTWSIQSMKATTPGISLRVSVSGSQGLPIQYFLESLEKIKGPKYGISNGFI